MSFYVENLLVTVCIFTILSWGCWLPLRGGQLFNGPVYCAAIGGYFAAYTTAVLGWPIPAGFVGGILMGGLFAFVCSFFLAALSMFQMAVVTIALIFITQTTFRNLEFLGGVLGISGVPAVSHLLLICFAAVVIVLWFLVRLTKSRWGRAMEVVKVDSETAGAMGIDVIRMSMALQTAGGLLGGLAGVIFTFNLGTIHPDIFGFGQLLYCFSIIMVGGRNTPWGCLFFAPVLWLIPEFFPAGITEYRNIMVGVVIIVSLLTMPDGIITRRLVERFEAGLTRVRRLMPSSAQSSSG